jgi:predicted helicase
MIGLYLLTTLLLEKEKTVKFGMSMRLEYRWIDYLVIFNDSKYIYYYEILDKLTREEVINIESEILELYKENRNNYFQTEYFYCDNYEEFHKTIIDVLNKKKINYISHNIHNFDRKYYDNKPDSFEPQKLKKVEIMNQEFKPYYYQQEVLDNIEKFYENNDIGKICWACGLGKALLGILIAQKLRCKLVVIGVPSIYLQKQMKNEIMKIFTNSNILFIGSELSATTNEDKIKEFINTEGTMSSCKFVITTYISSYLVSDNYNFDLKIGDEAHHLVGTESEKTKESFHKIKSNKTLFMTATEKVIENNRTNKVLYSMDDTKIFGKSIDEKSICWAIEQKKITDYYLIILKNTENEIDNIINSLNLDNNQEIKSSILDHKDLTHILIYTNKTENAELVKKYIDVILELNIININKDNYYNKSLHSNSKNNLDNEITKFKTSSWGIISSVYIFGEGFDCPKLNGVVFGENMDSDIRIVQSTLRPNRVDKNFPNKKAYVIIPYIDTENFITDNESFDKCRKIIHKIRNVDEKIEQKISVVSLNKPKEPDDPKDPNPTPKIKYHDIIENSDELTKIKLRLRYSKALSSMHTEEQDEFNYVKQLNKELNINSKDEYTEKIIKDKHKMYIENPEDYFRTNGVWSNWYDFLGVNTKKFIQDKNEWINFCKEKNVKSLEDYNELCKLYEQLPRNPTDFYIGCLDIDVELDLYVRKRTYSE